jgi:hypothetical protein
MESLVARDKAQAKKKGIFAAAAWGGTLVAGLVGLPMLLVVPGAAGAGYLTYRWFMYRAKRGMRF